MSQVPVKLSVAFETRRKKYCAAQIHVLPAHDIRYAPQLLTESRAKIAVADKAYNSENLYRHAAALETLLMVPQKKNTRYGLCEKKAKVQAKATVFFYIAGQSQVFRKIYKPLSLHCKKKKKWCLDVNKKISPERRFSQGKCL